MTKLFTLIKLLITLPLSLIYILSIFIPKNKKIWIFGSYKELFVDNSKYFFLFVTQNHSEIKAIWQTQSKSTYQYLKKKGYKVTYKYSLKGFYYGLQAKVAIVSSKRWNVNPYVLKRCFIVNVWHGIPLKKIEYDVTKAINKEFFRRQMLFKKLSKIWPYYKNSYDLYIASSKEHCKIIETAFKTGKNKIILSGEPSYDNLFINSKAFSGSYIAYLPTFRLNYDFNPFDDSFDGESWNKFLNTNNTKLIVKLHVNDNRDNYDLLKEEFSNIEIVDSDIDSAEILSKTKILITDFSSVLFDFANRKKPILFFAPDKEKYQKLERELYFDYNKICGNNLFSDWSSILEFLKKVDIDSFKNTDYLNDITGSSVNSCETLFHEITSRI